LKRIALGGPRGLLRSEHVGREERRMEEAVNSEENASGNRNYQGVPEKPSKRAEPALLEGKLIQYGNGEHEDADDEACAGKPVSKLSVSVVLVVLVQIETFEGVELAQNPPRVGIHSCAKDVGADEVGQATIAQSGYCGLRKQ
jgi:hypothetical protein